MSSFLMINFYFLKKDFAKPLKFFPVSCPPFQTLFCVGILILIVVL